MMINVVLADDHKLFIDGLKSILDDVEGINVVGVAYNGNQVIEILEQHKVDAVVLDIEMPEMGGVETARKIAKSYVYTKILIVTTHNSKQFILALMGIGASGYLLKNRSKEELVKAIRIVANGGNYYSTEILQIATSIEAGVKNKTPEVEFTKREKQILSLLGECNTSNEIATKLFIAPSTVETHIRNLLSKLEMPNRLYLVRYAVENGYVK